MSKLLIVIGLCITTLSTPVWADQPQTFPAAGTVEVAFSPNGGATAATIGFIGEAKQYILMSAYTLTSWAIGNALVDAQKRGVVVRVVADKDHNGGKELAKSVVSMLLANGVAVRINYAVAINHSKTIIVDGVSVENGSFNWSRAAGVSNAEDITIHRGFPQLAKAFQRDWMQK